MSYEVIWESRGLVKRFWDHLTGDDMVQSVVEIERDNRFDELRYVINDFLGITGVSFSPQNLEEISVLDKGASFSNPHIRIAVVTTSPEIAALATAYAVSLLNAYPTRIFDSLDNARSWLGEIQMS